MEKRGKSSKILIFIFFLPFLIFSLLQFLAPIVLPNGSVDNLDGISAVADNEDFTNELPAPWNFIYSAGDRLCHQKYERSFIINDNQMPFCARCTAIFLGITIGLGFMIFYKINLDEKFILLIIIGLAPIAVDGFGQQFEFWESNNITRLITGTLVGFVSGIAIGIIADELLDIISSRKKHKLNKKRTNIELLGEKGE